MRFQPSFRCGLMAVFLALSFGCSGGGSESGTGTGPAATVQTFYDHLNEGRYEEAKSLYSDAVQAEMFPDASAEEGFRNWAIVETHNKTLQECTIVSETADESGVKIEFELRFKSGETRQGNVTVSEENGSWRLGFIG